MLFDGPARLAKGIFANTPEVCSGGVASPFVWPTNHGAVGTLVAGGAGTVVTNPTTGALEVAPNFCGGRISPPRPPNFAFVRRFFAAAPTRPRRPHPKPPLLPPTTPPPTTPFPP